MEAQQLSFKLFVAHSQEYIWDFRKTEL